MSKSNMKFIPLHTVTRMLTVRFYERLHDCIPALVLEFNQWHKFTDCALSYRVQIIFQHFGYELKVKDIYVINV